MQKMTAARILFMRYKGRPNFITPYVLEVGLAREGRAWELSSGKFMDTTLFGVSVVDYDGATNTASIVRELSECFGSRDLAENHIRTVVGDAEGKLTIGGGWQ